MDLYKEYNRIRRNLMRQAKYHNINITKIPTAKQLISQTGKSNITKSDIKTISTQKQSLQAIVKTKPKKVSPISVQTFRPKSKKIKKPPVEKPKKSKKTKLATPAKRGKKPNYENYYKRYGTQYTQVTTQGMVIDRFTGDIIGSALFSSNEELGKYLYETYRDKKTKRMRNPEGYNINKAVRELEMFKYYIQNRIDSAFADYNRGGKGASYFGIDTVQKALDSFNKEDWKDAYERYEKYGDIAKEYLDQALYYTSQLSDHARAIVVMCGVLDLSIEDFDIDEAENTFYEYDDVMARYGD